jgi:hypothetical protein
MFHGPIDCEGTKVSGRSNDDSQRFFTAALLDHSPPQKSQKQKKQFFILTSNKDIYHVYTKTDSNQVYQRG